MEVIMHGFIPEKTRLEAYASNLTTDIFLEH